MERLFLTILNMSGTGAVVICVVLLLRLALKRAPKKYSYWLWSAAAFRLVCPVSWKSVFSVFSLAPTVPVAAEPASSSLAPASSIEYIPPDIGMMAQPRVTLPIPQLSEALNEALPAADPISSVNPVQVWVYLGAYLWLLGIAALLIWGAASYLRLRGRLRTAVRLEDGVFQSEAVGSPFLMGYLRPRIYIPYGLEGERLDYVLAHERFHIARRDYLVKLLAFLILALHWFNPLAWLAFYLMGRDMELRCDEAVLGRTAAKPADYSETLLSFATGGRFPRPGPLAFGETGVKVRIKNALRWKKPKLWVTVLALALVAAGVAACAANPADRPRETPAEPGREETDAEERVLLARLEEIPVSTRDSVLYCVVRAAGSELRYTLPLVNAEPSPEPRVGDLLEIRYRGTLPQTEPMEIPAVQRIRVVTEDYALAPRVLSEDAPAPVRDYALELVERQAEWLNQCGLEAPAPYRVTDAWVSALTRIDTGTAALDREIVMYRLEYRLKVDEPERVVLAGGMRLDGDALTEWSSGGQPYLILVSYEGAAERWERVGMVSDLTVREEYSAPELLEQYGDPYTAACMLLYQRRLWEREEPDILAGLDEGGAMRLTLLGTEGAASYDAPWDVANARYHFWNLKYLVWQTAEAPDGVPEDAAVRLETEAGTLTAFDGTDQVLWQGADGSGHWLLPKDSQAGAYAAYWHLRGWYDEAEYAALGLWVGAELVIPDRGQTPEEAAREFGDALAARGLLASPGSQFRNTYETAVVTDYEPFNRRYDESGYVDGHQWRFLLELIFVPENERALHYQMAGNTHEYTGGDPSVPAGAYACTRCCYVVREADGWHGVNCGTAW